MPVPPSPDLAAALTVATRLEEVRWLAEHLQAVCTAAGVDEMARFDCELAMVEAANNVVEHGYAARPEGELTLLIEADGQQVRMELRDRGAAVPEGHFERCRIVPEDAVRGRGTGIIQSCVDEVVYHTADGENRLVMIKRLG